MAERQVIAKKENPIFILLLSVRYRWWPVRLESTKQYHYDEPNKIRWHAHTHTAQHNRLGSDTREWITVPALTTHPHQKWFAPWSKKGYLVWPDERKCQTTIHLFDNWFSPSTERTSKIQTNHLLDCVTVTTEKTCELRIAKCLCFATHQRIHLLSEDEAIYRSGRERGRKG